MNGTAMALIGLVYFVPVELEKGVLEINHRHFALPVDMPRDFRNTLASIHLFVSEDRGKTWNRYQEIPSDGTRFTVKTTNDGLYWFSVQTVSKDGKVVLAKVDGEEPGVKVYVNADRRPIFRATVSGLPPPPPLPPSEVEKLQQANEALRREMTELRMTIEQLRKRIAELEKQRDSK